MLYKVTSHEDKVIKYFSDHTCNHVIVKFCDDVLNLWNKCYRVYTYENKKWVLTLANTYF